MGKQAKGVIKMSVLEDVPEEKIVHAIKAMVKSCDSYEDLDRALPLCITDGKYRNVIDGISEKLLLAIREQQVVRWDFDVNDKSHSNQRKTDLTSVSIPSDWKMPNMRKVAYGVIGSFRHKCLDIVAKFLGAISRAQSFEELDRIKDIALEHGIFIDWGIDIKHNHSIVDSKKVFTAYVQKKQELEAMEYFEEEMLDTDSGSEEAIDQPEISDDLPDDVVVEMTPEEQREAIAANVQNWEKPGDRGQKHSHSYYKHRKRGKGSDRDDDE